MYLPKGKTKLTEVNAGYTDFMTGEKARNPAIRMTL